MLFAPCCLRGKLYGGKLYCGYKVSNSMRTTDCEGIKNVILSFPDNGHSSAADSLRAFEPQYLRPRAGICGGGRLDMDARGRDMTNLG